MTINLTPKEEQARKRVCLAVDVPTVEKGLSLAEELSDYVGTFKANNIHHVAARQGIDIIEEFRVRGGDTFLDLKYHDTPQTAFNYARDSVVPGVYVFNIHVAGGEAFCKATMDGAKEGARLKGIERPKVIGVTVLTSLGDEDLAAQGLNITYDQLVMRRTELARKWGLDGIVCAANKAGYLEHEFGSDFTYVTPGIKWKGKAGLGQKQLYTPDKAVKDCSSSILVIGSAITKAGNVYDSDTKDLISAGTPQDRKTAAYEILQAMASEL
jgi:orotidine-5'-phosphate decarboxylase